MKRLLATALILFAGFAPLYAAEARVLETDGRVEIRMTPDEDWAALEEGMTVPVGATISTGFGASAIIQVGPAARLEVSALSRLTLEELIEREGLVESDLHLGVGRVRADVEAVEGVQSDFNLSSPVSTAAVRGTSFEFDGVNVRVFQGRVNLSNRFNQSTTVSDGESSSTTGDDDPASGDQSLEEESSVNIYTAGVEERTESETTTRESDAATLRVDLEIAQ